MRRTFAILAAFVLTTSFAHCQKLHHHQSLYWLRYQNQLFFSKKLFWTNEFDNRRFFHPDVENQYLLNSHLHRRSNQWDFGVGINYTVSYTSSPENGWLKTRHEIRPFAEANYDIPIQRMTLQQRLRIDNRFIQRDLDYSVLDESFYITRLDYRVQMKIPLVKNSKGINVVNLRIAYQIMVNLKENFYDQSRIYFLGDCFLNKNLSLELGYIHPDQRVLGRDEYFSRNVLRFSILHKMNWHRGH